LFPLLLAMGIGPALASTRSDESEDAPRINDRFGPQMAVALISVAVVVLPNLILYNQIADRLIRFADALYTGLEAERRGDWPGARAAVESAFATLGGIEHAEDALDTPYADIAGGLPDFAYLFRAAYLPIEGTSPLAAGFFALGRIEFAEGHFDRAAEHLETATQLAPHSGVLAFARAEALWAMDERDRALEAYRRAAELESQPGNEAYRDRMAAIEERIQELADTGTSDPAVVAERSRLLRLRGRWEEPNPRAGRLAPVQDIAK
jgi:tetratricopeptide (TPR) repeat protein